MFRNFLQACWGIVFLLLIAAILLLTVNLGFLKPHLEAEATALLGRKVEMSDNIKLRIVAEHPALVLHRVSVGKDMTAESVALVLRGLHPSRGLFVRLTAFQVDGKDFGTVDLPVSILPNGFSIDPLHGEFKKAPLNGRVKYTDDALDIEGEVKDIPLSLFLGDTAEGTADTKFHLEATGKTAEKLLGSLTGRVLLTNNGGTLTSASLKFWSSGLLSSLLPGKEDKTHLNCAIIDFNIKDGVADSRTIVVDTRDNTIFAHGRIDLPNQKIDMVLKPNPKNMQFVSFATPMRVTGALDSPSVTPEAGGMAKKIGGILLGVVNPAFALLSTMETGFGDYKGSCAAIVQQYEKR